MLLLQTQRITPMKSPNGLKSDFMDILSESFSTTHYKCQLKVTTTPFSLAKKGALPNPNFQIRHFLIPLGLAFELWHIKVTFYARFT